MHFNSQPHEEADYKKILRGIDYQIFQLTASRRGWLSARAVYGSSGLFQLTASRRGWHTGRPGADTVDFISTHSLTKRLTNIRFRRGCRCLFQLTASRRGWRKLSDCLKNARKFQLTASRRGWRWWLITPWSTPVFQLTASRRGWLCLHYIRRDWVFISTHSLTKRLTATWWWYSCRYVYFNSQPHEEADHEHLSFYERL